MIYVPSFHGDHNETCFHNSSLQDLHCAEFYSGVESIVSAFRLLDCFGGIGAEEVH